MLFDRQKMYIHHFYDLFKNQIQPFAAFVSISYRNFKKIKENAYHSHAADCIPHTYTLYASKHQQLANSSSNFFAKVLEMEILLSVKEVKENIYFIKCVCVCFY
jgi:hypothetical protein